MMRLVSNNGTIHARWCFIVTPSRISQLAAAQTRELSIQQQISWNAYNFLAKIVSSSQLDGARQVVNRNNASKKKHDSPVLGYEKLAILTGETSQSRYISQACRAIPACGGYRRLNARSSWQV